MGQLKIGMVENFDIRMRRLLSELGVLDGVDVLVVSAEVGAVLKANCG